MNNNSTKLRLLSLIIATAMIGSIMTLDESTAFAKVKNNEAVEGIGQSSGTLQSSECFSENGTSLASCNNLDTSLNFNFGQNALGQQ